MDSERDKELPLDGISRRRMLKRVGAGAAIAWSAPVLTSLRVPAFAQSPCNAPSCGCIGSSPVCGQNQECVVIPEVGTGECKCVANAFGSGGTCNGPTCPSGEGCFLHCSDGCVQADCLLLCGTDARKSSRSGRPFVR
jgi:hypothetical protein